LPWTIRSLLASLGAFNRMGSNLISYLLFERPYCRDLIRLGYEDAMRRKDEILRFLEMPPP
ncbi:MAG: patatin-like phospholipase family protein, partial [Bacteroidota bacterium]